MNEPQANRRIYKSVEAPGYDFLIWLIDAEMTRIRHGAPAPLRVKFVDETRWLDDVWRPLLPMIGAVEDDWIEDAWQQPYLSFDHTINDIIAAVRNGEAVPHLQASDRSRQEIANWLDASNLPAPIVITLREATHWPHRNSNVDAWVRFAAYLQAAGKSVVFVRDTEKVDARSLGIKTYLPASLIVSLRMALYEQAKLNFFVTNGPLALVWFSPVPYIHFATQWAGKQGMKYPWMRDNQRMVNTTDTYENLITEWDRWRNPARGSLKLPQAHNL